MVDVSEAELQDLYTWVDEIPLSRPKRNISRDFSDGVLMAEVVHHFFPKLVELHNYSSANATQQKMYNWNTLNQKVFKRMGFTLSKADFEAVANCQVGAVERVLKMLRLKILECKENGLPQGISPAQSMVPQAAAVVSTRSSLGAPTAKEYCTVVPGQQNVQQHQPSLNSHTSYQGPGSLPAAKSHKAASLAGPTMSHEAMLSKEQAFNELKETNEILETKVRKLEQLVRLKDAKISTLMAKLQDHLKQRSE